MMNAQALQPKAVTTDCESTPSRNRLHYLDGIRGLAALYVVIYHVMIQMGTCYDQLPLPLRWVTVWVRFGHGAVDVFIVLSGYCLMLPIAHSQTNQIRGGLVHFISRRARRILPPYYAALFLSVFLLYFGRLRFGNNAIYVKSPLTVNNLVLHLLLVHNFSTTLIMTINAVFWSIAVEWQIYFIFALLLLPCWRKFGIPAMFALATFISLGPHILLHGFLDLSCPWYVLLFAFGMTAALINFRPHLFPAWFMPPNLWKGLTVTGVGTAVITYVLISAHVIRWLPGGIWDITIGFTTACLLVYLTSCATGSTIKRKPSRLLRLLETRFLLVLGGFSYSLYLIHYRLLQIAQTAMEIRHVSAEMMLLLHVTMVIPVCIGAAYLFHLCFERPFLSEFAQKADASVRPLVAET